MNKFEEAEKQDKAPFRACVNYKNSKGKKCKAFAISKLWSNPVGLKLALGDAWGGNKKTKKGATTRRRRVMDLSGLAKRTVAISHKKSKALKVGDATRRRRMLHLMKDLAKSAAKSAKIKVQKMMVGQLLTLFVKVLRWDAYSMLKILLRWFNPLFFNPTEISMESASLNGLAGRKEGGLWTCAASLNCIKRIKQRYAALSTKKKRDYRWLAIPDDKLDYSKRGRAYYSEKGLFPWLRSGLGQGYIKATMSQLLDTELPRAYASYEWCKRPKKWPCKKDADQCDFVLCPKAIRESAAVNNYHFTGNEKLIPHAMLTMTRKSGASVVCEAKFFFHFIKCTTCCCTNGLVVTSKSVILTKVGKGQVSTCSDWYYFIDALAGTSLAMLRATQVSSVFRDYAGQCMKDT